MKEIKFRAFLKENKKMLPVTYLTLSDEEGEQVGVADCNNEGCVLCVDFYDYEKVELIQYTGLKDIYEGDIVDYLGDIDLANSNVLRVIEYKEEEACFVARLPVGVEGEEAVYLNEHDFKVIGNIYENPELLGGVGE